nr:uncharacterized protein LOC117685868 [Crassostrea gigas]
MKMGDELEMEGLAKRPSTPTPESKKNQKAETDSTSHVPFEGYSPAHDSNSLSNWSECQFNAKVEDSILTNLRRTNPGKIRKLEKRMREPEFKPQFDLLRTLLTRVMSDCEQIQIIFNFVEDKLNKVDNHTKRVKFTTL